MINGYIFVLCGTRGHNELAPSFTILHNISRLRRRKVDLAHLSSLPAIVPGDARVSQRPRELWGACFCSQQVRTKQDWSQVLVFSRLLSLKLLTADKLLFIHVPVLHMLPYTPHIFIPLCILHVSDL